MAYFFFFIISYTPSHPHHFPHSQMFLPWIKYRYPFHKAEMIHLCSFIEQVGITHFLTLKVSWSSPSSLTLLQPRFTLSTPSLLQHYIPPSVWRERCSEEAAQFNPTHTFNTPQQPPLIISPPVFDHQFIIRACVQFRLRIFQLWYVWNPRCVFLKTETLWPNTLPKMDHRIGKEEFHPHMSSSILSPSHALGHSWNFKMM